MPKQVKNKYKGITRTYEGEQSKRIKKDKKILDNP